MKITSSYGVEIRKAGGALSMTLKTYREAVRVLALFYDTVWDDLSAVKEEKKRFKPCGAHGAQHKEEPCGIRL